MIGALLGGIGLFLLGMTLLTDGLQALAGDALRDLLRRWTRTPATGLASGTLVTALVQSSSATTLATIGFVGAGLLTFPQAIGIVYGANLGTTTTAWIVAAVGLKVRIDVFALPLVGVGAALRLFLHGRSAALGTALAGFGLIFVGIDVLQEGMATLSQRVDPAAWGTGGLFGSVLLVLVGATTTVIMQSSSAAMATTLAAVHAGTLSFEQAAALAIGQNVGTTVTAAVGSIGGSVAARRTALAHVLFNVGTGLVALLLLGPSVWAVRETTEAFGVDDPALALSAFHTAFNLLGVALFFPRTHAFAAWVERLVPERGRGLARRLAYTGTGVPVVLLETARLTVIDVGREILQVASDVLGPGPLGREGEERLAEAEAALGATRAYLAPLRTDPTTQGQWRRHLAVLHAVDHLHRLAATCRAADPSAVTTSPEVRDAAAAAGVVLADGLGWLETPDAQLPPSVEGAPQALATMRQEGRAVLLQRVAEGRYRPEEADARIEALRWLEAVGEHAARSLHHLRGASEEGESAREAG